MSEKTITNAVIGGIVSIILGFIPFSPILGGGVAGYLEKNNSNGIKIGAISGLIASIPMVVFLFFIGLMSTQLIGIQFGGIGLILFFGFVGIISTLYTVGLSTIGGYLGVYIYKQN